MVLAFPPLTAWLNTSALARDTNRIADQHLPVIVGEASITIALSGKDGPCIALINKMMYRLLAAPSLSS